MPSFRRPLAETLESRTLYAATNSLFGGAFTFGGGGFDNAQKAIQVPNGSGTVIVTGLFSGTTNFAAQGQRAAVLTAQGDTDIFVASYNGAGRLNWAIRLGGTYHSKQMREFEDRDVQINQRRFSRYVGRIGAQPTRAGEYVNDVAVDASGNIYLAGAFRESLRVGSRTFTADDTFTSDYYDALVVKLTAAGAVSWAKQYGSAFDDDAMSIGLDARGGVVVGGYYSRQINFDKSNPSGLLRTEGRDAGFAIRLNQSNGALNWAYQFDSDSVGIDERNAVNDIAVTRNGDVYLAGTFASEADFQPGRGEYTLESEGKTDAFLAKLNRKGVLQWAQGTGGDDYDGNSAVALDADGNVYTAGYFTDEADVDPRPGVELIYETHPEDNKDDSQFSDLLVSKVTPDGAPVWQKQVGGGYIELVGDLAVGSDGGVNLIGSFFNTMDVDPGRGVYSLSSTEVNTDSIKDNNTRFGRNESYDWFTLKLSPRGYFVAAAKFGGADDDYASGVSLLANNQLLVAGRAVRAVGADRDERQEQSLIEYLNADFTEAQRLTL